MNLITTDFQPFYGSGNRALLNYFNLCSKRIGAAYKIGPSFDRLGMTGITVIPFTLRL